MTPTLRAQIDDCSSLPSLPTVAVEVLRLARSSESDMKVIAAVINRDPALSGRVLKTVNSSFYGRSQKVTTIDQALVVMGLQSVRTLVLGFSLVDGLIGRRSRGFDHQTYWRRSFYAAVAAKELGVACRVMQTEELFVCGLLADIGMLVLDACVPEPFGRACALVTTHAEQHAVESSKLGGDHAEVGGYVADKWKLPPVLAEPIRWHAEPDRADDETLMTMASILRCAGRCADVFVDKEPAQAIADVRRLAGELLAASPVPAAGGCDVFADALLDKLGVRVQETTAAFQIDLGPASRYDKILRDATEALVEITMTSQQQAMTLQQQQASMQEQFARREVELKKQAITDGLTGLANRAEFDRFLGEEVAGAAAVGEPLSLILVDIDRFKGVNDTHGHQVGDSIIKFVADLLDRSCRTGDLAARYGGEEMALVLPGTDRATAAALAEAVRSGLCAQSVDCGDVRLPITASFGVSAYEPPAGPLNTGPLLIKAADKALYHAKESGRNRVKVFTLPPRRAA